MCVCVCRLTDTHTLELSWLPSAKCQGYICACPVEFDKTNLGWQKAWISGALKWIMLQNIPERLLYGLLKFGHTVDLGCYFYVLIRLF